MNLLRASGDCVFRKDSQGRSIYYHKNQCYIIENKELKKKILDSETWNQWLSLPTIAIMLCAVYYDESFVFFALPSALAQMYFSDKIDTLVQGLPKLDKNLKYFFAGFKNHIETINVGALFFYVVLLVLFCFAFFLKSKDFVTESIFMYYLYLLAFSVFSFFTTMTVCFVLLRVKSNFR